MAIVFTSPVTGAAQTGLTSPTYTITADTSVAVNLRQSAVTALGGTQTGVGAHSIASPFTLACQRPLIYKSLGYVDPAKGITRSVPRNTHKVMTRKGVVPLAGQSPVVMNITTVIDVPAGAELADPLSVKAALSLHFGAVTQQSAGIGDTCILGIL